MNNQENCGCGNQDMIKGILAITVGVVCIAMAYNIILKAILFLAGIVLVYYGLTMLKMDHITSWVDGVIKKVQLILPNSKK